MLIRLSAWFLAAVVCAGSVFSASPIRVSAASEFCAAGVHAVVPLSTTIPGQYVAQLETEGTGTVSGELAMYSAGKIYTVKFPAVSFNQVTRSADAHGGALSGPFHFTYHINESAPVYFTFAESTPIEAVWVADASIDGKPAAQCPAMPFLGTGGGSDDLLRHVPLRSPAAVLLGKFAAGSCGELYTPAQQLGHAKLPFDPQTIASRHESDSGGFVMEMALSDGGHVIDAWPLAMSSSDEMNTGILEDAKTYTFKPAQFLCQPVPSYYLVPWTWDRGFGE